MSEIVGMWVHVSEPEHWRVGQIVEELGNGFYLARMEHANPEFPVKHYYEPISLGKYAMLSSQCDWAGLTLFETRSDLQTYTVRAFQQQHLEMLPIVMHRPTPFPVVIANHVWLLASPTTASLLISH